METASDHRRVNRGDLKVILPFVRVTCEKGFDLIAVNQNIDDSPYFFGDTLTILDLYIWMLVNWFEEFAEFRAACPKVVALAENVMHRPRIAPIHKFNFGDGLGWGGQF